MIRLENLTKIFYTGDKPKVVADNINVVFPTGAAIALLGRNGAGKSTLLQIIAGSVLPTSGRVITNGSISWPVGFGGSFHKDMTGAQNTRFVARIHGVDTDQLLAYVEDFAELEGHFHMPVRTYSAGMKSRLAFGLAMGIQFDFYLADEVTATGDAAFKKKSRLVFKSRMQESGSLFVTHSMRQAKNFCSASAVLEHGQLTYYDNVEDGIKHYMSSQGAEDEDDY